ncbi:MAG: cupredoxin domain-containing protein [Thermoleophilaceae bacterium]|nr:cupredoxin domain-containing protein [Thermoleophilaceae bacterium]
MNIKSFSLIALVAAFAIVFAGCAQDSTDITNENPAMQEEIMKGTAEQTAADAAAAEQSSTDTTRSEAAGGTDGTKLALIADPSGALKYNKTKLNAKPGNITITLINESTTPHDVAVETESGKSLGESEDVSEGTTKLVLKDVKAGTYTFYCSLPGHRQAGMEGTLTVR